MSSGLHQWESDPLFSAAEVVQDSADRMESIFRLLFHELSLVRGDHPDPRLLKLIEYHRRNLATILETTRWQLEDFERAINSSAAKNESRREHVILRHSQFISAIRAHITNVENSLQDPSYGETFRDSEWVSLNEQDRNGLALFLSGGNSIEQSKYNGKDDSILLRRFLESATTDGLPDNTAEITESIGREMDNRVFNGVHDFGANNLRNVVSDTQISVRSGFDAQDSLQEISCEDRDKDGSWDMEANEGKNKTFFQKSQQKGLYRGGKVFRFLNNLKAAFGYRVNRNYTKRLKDGEEQRDSPSYIDASYAAQLRLFTNAMPPLGRLRAHISLHRTIYLLLLVLSLIIVIGFLLSRSV
ncbi:uncharacterized protein LOC116198136 [Punica granatum]|uniref:Uncharacterized protein LOC116198136 n=1 Tax=Punica granatum TaxID=22663 RepID=A0A218X2Q4_PUNGR|nr:uncharacterized protein LOC116198136 [Punica granatum]OWM79088.1 hypothetical protein CDL15_Pgr003259 [Punica granatum]